MKKETLSLSRAASHIGFHRDDLILWEKQGRITPGRHPKTNKRCYKKESLEEVAEEIKILVRERVAAAKDF
jgi:DNA-binding transcriptional MerR regulator